jgi:hypothetical protein
MDSDPKPGNTDRETLSVFAQIRERVGSILTVKWRRATRNARDIAERDGIPEEDREAFYAGFEYGYWNGAQDAASIKPSLLHQKKKVH